MNELGTIYCDNNKSFGRLFILTQSLEAELRWTRLHCVQAAGMQERQPHRPIDYLLHFTLVLFDSKLAKEDEGIFGSWRMSL